MQIVIAGAGIGGLAAALALHADGHEVRVIESVPEIKPLGVGINLLPQAVKVLDELGLAEALLSRGIATRELSYFNRFGQRIWTEPRGLFGGFQAPQISLSRGALQMTLLQHALERLGAERIVTGRKLMRFETRGDVALAVFSAADQVVETEGDILVCADGIHSMARRQMYPEEGAPIYSGRVLWRSTSYAEPFLSGATMIMAGYEAQKFVAYPIEPAGAGRQRINWIAELRVPVMREKEDWYRAGDIADFLPAFADWKFDWLDVPQLIGDAERIYEYPMVDRDPVEAWTSGSVTLVGDAAHAMYPIGSNGASQAILDAGALVRALRAHTNPRTALQVYEAERLPATAAIVRANRHNGPEHCMQLAHERAPEGFNLLEDVFAPGELQAIADHYKSLTGMKRKAS